MGSYEQKRRKRHRERGNKWLAGLVDDPEAIPRKLVEQLGRCLCKGHRMGALSAEKAILMYGEPSSSHKE